VMNWRCISNKFWLLSLLSFLLLVACVHPQQTTDTHPTDWHALENPLFLDLPLTQVELNEQSNMWVKSLGNELRRSWDSKMRGASVEEWLVSQEKEVERELASTEDGSIYPLEFNMRVGERILRALRKTSLR